MAPREPGPEITAMRPKCSIMYQSTTRVSGYSHGSYRRMAGAGSSDGTYEPIWSVAVRVPTHYTGPDLPQAC